MAWVHAIWEEDDIEMEEVLPSNWVNDSSIFWPLSANAKGLIDERRPPGKTWYSFPLKRIKVCSDDNYAACSMKKTAAVNSDTQGHDSIEKGLGQKKTASVNSNTPGHGSIEKGHGQKKVKQKAVIYSDTEDVCDDVPPPPEYLKQLPSATKSPAAHTMRSANKCTSLGSSIKTTTPSTS